MTAVRIALANVLLATRTRSAMFFTFIFPLAFLFVYAGIFAHGNPQYVAYFFGPVVTLQVIGSSLWGLGLQSVIQRERGGLRRFRLAPIGAGAMVLSNLIANYILLLPTLGLMLVCAVFIFHMPLTIGPLDLFTLVTVGALAFAGFGLSVGSIANTMQEAQVYNQVVWFPLLFLSGATLPLPMLPQWLQRVAAFLPATYLVATFQDAMLQTNALGRHAAELVALLISGVAGLLFAWKLFRWEKEEPIPRSRKALALLFLIPFLLVGLWMNSRGNPGTNWNAIYGMIQHPAERSAPAHK